MRKCVWCGEDITERRGYKQVMDWITIWDLYHGGWLHRKCYPEWYSFAVFRLPQCIAADCHHYNGWLTDCENAMSVPDCFDFAVGKLTGSRAFLVQAQCDEFGGI